MLASSAPLMRDLTLHMVYLFWGGVREVPKVNHSAHFNIFRSTVMPLKMPYLRSLSLRRWIFTVEELKIFLSANATTLRDLHLLGCFCGDNEVALARWGGRALSLSSVELSGFLAVLDRHSANAHGWETMDQIDWSQMKLTVSDREARHLEMLWLGGRENQVERLAASLDPRPHEHFGGGRVSASCYGENSELSLILALRFVGPYA